MNTVQHSIIKSEDTATFPAKLSKAFELLISCKKKKCPASREVGLKRDISLFVRRDNTADN